MLLAVSICVHRVICADYILPSCDSTAADPSPSSSSSSSKPHQVEDEGRGRGRKDEGLQLLAVLICVHPGNLRIPFPIRTGSR